LNEENQAHLSI